MFVSEECQGTISKEQIAMNMNDKLYLSQQHITWSKRLKIMVYYAVSFEKVMFSTNNYVTIFLNAQNMISI